MIAPMEEYLLDLRGYTVVLQALDRDDIGAINGWIDALPPLKTGEWLGNVYLNLRSEGNDNDSEYSC